MRVVAICMLLFGYCRGAQTWCDQVKERADEGAIEWLKEKIKTDLHNIDLTTFTDNPCKYCSLGGLVNVEPKIYVFMSFAVPEETWLNLSAELEHYAGVFVISGMPNNSFLELSKQLTRLKQKGMRTAVLIDPNLFKQFQIHKSPTFVFTDGLDSYKISGNISLRYALEYTDSSVEDYQLSLQRAEE